MLSLSWSRPSSRALSLRPPLVVVVLVTVAAGISAVACRPAGDAGLVEVKDFPPGGRIAVQPGHGWITPYTPAIPVSRGGDFRTRHKTRLLEAFLDTNGNGVIDKPTEPSGRCVRGDTWQCKITPVRLTVHRVQGTDDAGTTSDTTVALGEVFDVRHSRLDQSTMICDPRKDTCMGAAKQEMFIDSSATVVFPLVAPSCGIVATQFPTAGMELEVTARSMAKRRFLVHLPAELKMDVTAGRSPTGVALSARTSRPVERVLIWLERHAQDAPPKPGPAAAATAVAAGSETPRADVVWTSESLGEGLEISAVGFAALIPPSALASCAEGARCRINVQAATMAVDAEVTSVSEARQSLEVPS